MRKVVLASLIWGLAVIASPPVFARGGGDGGHTSGSLNMDSDHSSNAATPATPADAGETHATPAVPGNKNAKEEVLENRKAKSTVNKNHKESKKHSKKDKDDTSKKKDSK